jgi:4-amino-4-deoxy-L-arabinose transferase-like glycosyltransferase
MKGWSNEARGAAAILTVLTLFRFWYCTYNDLVPDEAYYWLWSQNLDLSYYSKGPAVAWTIAAGTALFGDTTFGVRWLSVLLSAGTGWLIFRLGARLYNDQVGLVALAAAMVMPLYAVGSVLMTIDPLSVFFWVLAMHVWLDALERPSYTLWRWGLAGFIIGSGFLAKYTNAFELLCGALFLGLSREHRPWLKSQAAALLLLVFACCTLPVLWWNAGQGWITAKHLQQGGNLEGALHLSFREFLQFWEQQGLVISPLLFVAVIVAVLFPAASRSHPMAPLFLRCFFLPLFLFYAVLGVHDAGNPNWTAPCYLAGAVLVGAASVSWWARAGWWRVGVSLIFAVATLQTVIAHETHWLGLRKDPLLRVRGWSQLGQEVQAVILRYQPAIIIADERGLASELAFYLPGQPRTYIPRSTKIENQFSFWPSYGLSPGTRALFITGDPSGTLPAGLAQDFPSTQKVDRLIRRHRGREIEFYDVWIVERP